MPTQEEILAALEIDGIAKAPARDFELANEARKLYFEAERRLGRRINRWIFRGTMYGVAEPVEVPR